MEQSHINPIKEIVTPDELLDLINNSSYPKPQWMLNDSPYDTIWEYRKVGVNPKHYDNKKNRRNKFNFKKKVSHNEYLTDKVNETLLIDIQNSILYLYVTGKITRPKRICEIAISIISLIRNANEHRYNNNMPPIRNLEQIKFNDLKDYIYSFNIENDLFEETIEFILVTYNSKNEINWKEIKSNLNIKSRKLQTLKHKVNEYIKTEEVLFQSKQAYNREYPNANVSNFDINFSLIPKMSTISNQISKLEALYTSRPAQKYKFRHSPIKLFSSGRTIFDDMQDRVKTSLMPISLSLSILSSALHFVRVYGKPLRHYLADLNNMETARIKELGIKLSTSRNCNLSIKQYAYENTIIPEELKSLKITSWIKNDVSALEEFSQLRNGMSVPMVVRLYTAAIWILLASFTAARSGSLLTLKRNCFVQSPIDGLFDLVLRIPKSSERLELEEVHRPIPDLVYDYGLEFASLACDLEDRRGFIGAEDELFLFGSSLSYRSVSAAREDGGISLSNSLEKDYIDTSIDMFMDWINTPLIEGKRWYPKTHQFRRSFAVIYFNFSDETGLDELSWFMGHSNLDQTFYYAEICPDDDWIDEAEATIARIGASLDMNINGDETIKSIINDARSKTEVTVILEPLVRKLIDKHKTKTGQQVRFHKVSGKDIFFYFTNPED